MSYPTPVPNLNAIFVFMISMNISEKRPHSPEKNSRMRHISGVYNAKAVY